MKVYQNKLEKQVHEYKNAATAISNDADRLRAKLASAKALSCPVNQSGSTDGTDGGRDSAMGEALRFATDLIEERDRIALQYNELRSQCKVQ